jgi:hypothetical protein
MNGINIEAIDALATAVRDLLPEVTDPDLQPQVRVYPRQIISTGIGSLAGLSQEPVGEILGRRLEARVAVTVKARTLEELATSATLVSRSLVGAERADLRQRGIYRLSLNLPESGSLHPVNGGPDAIAQQDLPVDVLFEYLKHPEAAAGTITDIRQNLNVATTGELPRMLISSNFTENSLDWFEIADDPLATRSTPSLWQYNAAESRIEQISSIWGGSSQPNVNKPGTYLVLRATPKRPAVENLMLKVRLQSIDEDGIGIVFRWQDVDNFYFFLMDKRRNYRILGKKVAGEFLELSTPTLDTSRGFETNVIYDLKLLVTATEFKIYLDDQLALRGQDTMPPVPGRVGCMCRTNNQAHFYRIDLIKL